MTVKDFILLHPSSTLDMMTPGGYVYLTPEKTQALLEGENTMGHPGRPEYAMEITAEDLLSQHIHSAKYSKGVRSMLTDYDQAEQECIGLDLDPAEILERLNEKLDRNYSDFMSEWLKLEPSALIENAEEIAATKQVYDEIKSNEYGMAYFEYLLRFENPLEVVRDQWKEEHFCPDISGEMSHALWYLMDKREAERDYPLDGEYAPLEQDQGVRMC